MKRCKRCNGIETERCRKYRKTQEHKFECQECDYKCSAKNDLSKHIKTVHRKIKDLQCEECDFKSSTSSGLNIHIKTVHKKIKDFQCEKCDFKSSTGSVLYSHIRAVHKKIKSFQCNECDYNCSAKGNLSQHIDRVHKKVKNFQCKECDYKSFSKEHLNIHIKQIHKKIKDFQCEQCDYSCSTNSSLSQHINNIHKKIKKFNCDKCDLKFSGRSNLSVHIKRIHTLERPFKCLDENCDIKFVTNSDMKTHFNSFHTLEGRLRQKKRENRVYNHIFVKNDINCQREMHIDFKCLYNEDEKENQQNTKFCRIDYYSVLDNFILFTECDENSHMDYDVSCEVSRMMKIQESMVLQGITKPVVWIRFNPDSFKIDDITQKILFNNRAKTVVDFIKKHQPSNDLEIHYFSYDQYKIDEIKNYTSSNDIKQLFHYH
jgi:hypothetical protein